MQELAKPEPDADAEAQAFELAKPQADAEPQPMEHLGQQGQRPSLHRQTRSPSLLGHAPDLGQQGQRPALDRRTRSPSLLGHAPELGQQGQRPGLDRRTRSPSLLVPLPPTALHQGLHPATARWCRSTLGQQGQRAGVDSWGKVDVVTRTRSPSLLVHLGQDSAGKVDVATQRAAAKRQQLPVRNQWQHGQRPRRKDRSAIAKISKSRQ